MVSGLNIKPTTYNVLKLTLATSIFFLAYFYFAQQFPVLGFGSILFFTLVLMDIINPGRLLGGGKSAFEDNRKIYFNLLITVVVVATLAWLHIDTVAGALISIGVIIIIIIFAVTLTQIKEVKEGISRGINKGSSPLNRLQSNIASALIIGLITAIIFGIIFIYSSISILFYVAVLFTAFVLANLITGLEGQDTKRVFLQLFIAFLIVIFLQYINILNTPKMLSAEGIGVTFAAIFALFYIFGRFGLVSGEQTAKANVSVVS